MFESEREPSQLEEVDFDELIKAKIIDKSTDKPKGSAFKHEAESEGEKAEEFSPSWFNVQNQRFDVDDDDKDSDK
jgi:hypothetical protein